MRRRSHLISVSLSARLPAIAPLQRFDVAQTCVKIASEPRVRPQLNVLQYIDERVYVGEKRGFKHRVDVLQHVELRPYARLGSNFYARLRDIETLERRDGGQAGT